jgi:hypothetical protein
VHFSTVFFSLAGYVVLMATLGTPKQQAILNTLIFLSNIMMAISLGLVVFRKKQKIGITDKSNKDLTP